MGRIRASVENLAGDRIPEGFGSLSALLKSFGIECDAGERLRLTTAVRSLCRERSLKPIPVWNPSGWRAVNHYPRQIVEEAIKYSLPGMTPEPDLFNQ
jgi:hypothetical protein